MSCNYPMGWRGRAIAYLAMLAVSLIYVYLLSPGVLSGDSRSPQWQAVRDRHLAEHPECAVCGHRKNLQVHHVVPFHVDPALELNPDNLITLGSKCPTGNHHLLFGHLGDWKCWNEHVRADAAIWRAKIEGRRRVLDSVPIKRRETVEPPSVETPRIGA